MTDVKNFPFVPTQLDLVNYGDLIKQEAAFTYSTRYFGSGKDEFAIIIRMCKEEYTKFLDFIYNDLNELRNKFRIYCYIFGKQDYYIFDAIDDLSVKFENNVIEVTIPVFLTYEEEV